MSGEEGRSAGTVTREQLVALFDRISKEERQPHQCVVHPDGGVCLDCGQPWRKTADGYERVVFGREEPT